MIKLTSEQFDKQKKNGVYVFITNNCVLCDSYLKDLEKESVSNWYLIDCDEDVDYYMDVHNLNNMPDTRVYKDDVIMWEKSGILYDFQLNEVRRTVGA